MAFSTDDFNKIWASTSPLTPYEFSDDNYKQGWNFVGATPPSRQMWDFLQKQNDEKAQFLLEKFGEYLPLSGGTMQGDIKGNPVTLTADDDNNSASLVLEADGTMTWNGVAINDGAFIKVEHIRVNCSQGVQKYDITAPTVAGYQFVAWVSTASFNNVLWSYIESAWTPSAILWTAEGITNTTAFDCVALYVRKW